MSGRGCAEEKLSARELVGDVKGYCVQDLPAGPAASQDRVSTGLRSTFLSGSKKDFEVSLTKSNPESAQGATRWRCVGALLATRDPGGPF
jgi:hypothetical protein